MVYSTNNIIQQKGAGTPYAFWAHHKPQHNMDTPTPKQ